MSPPMPLLPGSATPQTAAAAMAASAALPPARSTRSPAAVTSGWALATMPPRAMTTPRCWECCLPATSSSFLGAGCGACG